MIIKPIIVRLMLPVAVVFLLSACNFNKTTQIKAILDNPRYFNGKETQIKGQVTDIYSLIVLKYFTVADNTGKIIVVTDRPLPRKGAIIKIKGTVEEGFSFGDQQSTVINESKIKGISIVATFIKKVWDQDLKGVFNGSSL